MSSISLVFPSQLYSVNQALDLNREVYLVEEHLFFNQFRFHKVKLQFQRASLKSYSEQLVNSGYKLNYIDAQSPLSDIRQLLAHLHSIGVKEVHYTDPTDYLLERRLKRVAEKLKMKLIVYDNPSFINKKEHNKAYFGSKSSYFQTDFYIKQRKRLEILVESGGTPIGGKWSFDTENRLKFPKNKTAPPIRFSQSNKYWVEAEDYVSKHYSDNPGQTSQYWVYPIDEAQSHTWLNNFFIERFKNFGVYEDAIVKNEHLLYHSMLTPMLNSGLLNPNYVVEQALQVAVKEDIPINSREGFIRQVISWREFIRGIYEEQGNKQRLKNFWGFNRPIPKSFYDGTTGIPPIDQTIKKVLATGYCHHIERLMVLGNFMLLCEFSPDAVYQWFMEMFIDSYDWVMVPNVYGMSQFADGGIMCTKPYISGSNYILKMSDYSKGPWCEVWDALFWRFIATHEEYFKKNFRMAFMLKTWEKMSIDKQEQHLLKAEAYLASL